MDWSFDSLGCHSIPPEMTCMHTHGFSAHSCGQKTMVTLMVYMCTCTSVYMMVYHDSIGEGGRKRRLVLALISLISVGKWVQRGKELVGSSLAAFWNCGIIADFFSSNNNKIRTSSIKVLNIKIIFKVWVFLSVQFIQAQHQLYFSKEGLLQMGCHHGGDPLKSLCPLHLKWGRSMAFPGRSVPS